MQNPEEVHQAATYILKTLPDIAGSQLGIILGTGLGGLADSIEIRGEISYKDIPHFPVATVDSHRGRFLFGHLQGIPLVLQQGRCHLYEGYSPEEICMGVRVMAELGIHSLVVTNAAGALNPRWDAGDLMLITDHINMTGRSPLTGSNHDDWGVRFPDMSQVYDLEYQHIALETARSMGIRLERGIYVGIPGPQFETPAETRFYRGIGAEAVGMSTVLEVIAARHRSLRVLGISCLTNKNLPDCMAPAPLEQVIRVANAAQDKMSALVKKIIPQMIQ